MALRQASAERGGSRGATAGTGRAAVLLYAGEAILAIARLRTSGSEWAGSCRHAHRRNVPDAVHATLKSRAALAGQPLTECLLAEIRRVAEQPTAEELAERLLRRPVPRLDRASAAFRRSHLG